MSLAFWRRKQASADAPAPRDNRASRALPDDESARGAATSLRTRARRRLIGAAALLLLAVVIVPMLLDPEPRPVPDNIPIDIPSDKTKFSPRLSLPPVPAPETTPVAPPPDMPPPGKGAEKAEKAPERAPAAASKAAAPSDAATKAAPRAAEEERARAALEGKNIEKPVATAKAGTFAVQAAATSTEASARELSARLKKAGLAPYTERVDTAEGPRYRVRVGPYASREEAERARVRLKSLGINGNVVGA